MNNIQKVVGEAIDKLALKHWLWFIDRETVKANRLRKKAIKALAKLKKQEYIVDMLNREFEEIYGVKKNADHD